MFVSTTPVCAFYAEWFRQGMASERVDVLEVQTEMPIADRLTAEQRFKDSRRCVMLVSGAGPIGGTFKGVTRCFQVGQDLVVSSSVRRSDAHASTLVFAGMSLDGWHDMSARDHTSAMQLLQGLRICRALSD